MRRRTDDGAAMVEFLVLAVTLAVPLCYLLLAVFDVQRVAYGANASTREAARVFVRAPSTAEAENRAAAAAQITLGDHGIEPGDGVMAISCSASPCLTPGATVQVTFRTQVSLPFLPSFADHGLASIPVSATHTQVVDRYSEVRP